MTSGTNILSVSEQLQLPFVPGVSAARSKLSIPSCPSPWEEHTREFQLSLRSWSPCCDPGGTAGDRLVTGQRTVVHFAVVGQSTLSVHTVVVSSHQRDQPCLHQLFKTTALEAQSCPGWLVEFPSRRGILLLTDLICFYTDPQV